MILNLDCRHGLAMLPDNSVDAILTDPPYERQSGGAGRGLIAHGPFARRVVRRG